MRHSSKTQSISDVIELSKEYYKIDGIFFDDTSEQKYYKLRFIDSRIENPKENQFDINVFRDFDYESNKEYALIHDLFIHHVRPLKFDVVKEFFKDFTVKYQVVTKCSGEEFNKCYSIEYPEEAKYKLERIYPPHIYFLADTHFHHGTRLKNTPYKSMQEYNDKLIQKINAVVPEYAILVLVGDVYVPSDSKMGRQEQIEELTNIRKQINCEKIIIIRGNHDKLTLMDYLKCGFYDVRDNLILHDYDGSKIISTHEEIQDDIGEYKNIFGHIHKPEIAVTESTFNCSANVLDGIPKSLLEILEMMKEKTKNKFKNI